MPPDQIGRATRCYPSPLGAGRQLGRAFHAQPCSPAAVAHDNHPYRDSLTQRGFPEVCRFNRFEYSGRKPVEESVTL